MVQEYVEKKCGFKAHNAYIAEMKRSLGLTIYNAPDVVEELERPRSIKVYIENRGDKLQIMIKFNSR